MHKQTPPAPDDVLSEGRTALLKTIRVQSETPCPVYGDDPSQMTGGRLLARFLSQFRWYYPAGSSPATDLDQAWAHYEHVTLARVYTDDPKDLYCRATPGETDRPTRLYPFFSTPTKELGDFGISVRMYFSTILTLAGFLGLAGFLNLPLSKYFFDTYYSSNKQDLVLAVSSSAVCLDRSWVECDGSCRQNEDLFRDRWFDKDNSNLVATNDCDFEDWLIPGLLSFSASILLIFLFGIAFFWLQRKAEVVFDEQVQTASDYSIKISNPPPDALDPDEWRNFLQRFGHVTACSVGIDNALLLEKLVKRRKLLKQISFLLPVDCDVRDGDALASAVANSATGWTWPWCCCCCWSTTQSIYNKIQTLQGEIAELLRMEYRAVAVFATFDSERAQRNALHTLGTGKLNVWYNRLDKDRFGSSNRLQVQEAAKNSELPECKCNAPCNAELAHVLTEDEELETHSIKFVASGHQEDLEDALLFRGKHVVQIKEAGEPNDVRWKDLQVSSRVRLFKFVASTLALIWFITWSGFFIYGLERRTPGTVFTPIFITVTNILVPKICEIINAMEAHSTEHSRQGSLYIKVTLFRWFNSAIALTIVTGFTKSIAPAINDNAQTLNQSVYNLIYAEMFTIPIIKLIDIMGFVRKHILAPRARDQEEMNSFFIGGKFELAERYTDATKVLFVALFYSAILPQSLFLGAAALLIHFVVGKFCLLRMWRPTPDIGSGLSKLSRNYFFSTSLLVHVVMSAYFWSGYPYDNLCQTQYGYSFCNQDFLRNAVFPPLPRFQPEGSEWMSSSQATITSCYSWTALFMVIASVVIFIRENTVPFVQSFFKSSYEPDGRDQGISFSSVLHLYEVHGYIPQLREPGLAYPLLASDVSKVDTRLIGWRDPFHGYGHHSLAEDVRDIMGCESGHVVLSQVRHWPPEK